MSFVELVVRGESPSDSVMPNGHTVVEPDIDMYFRWLRQEYQLEFPPDKQPPLHMPIAYGLVGLSSSKPKTDLYHPLSQPEPSGGVVGGGVIERLQQGTQGSERLQQICQLCKNTIENVSGSNVITCR